MKTLPSTGSRRNTATLGVAALALLGMVGVSYHEYRQYSRANADAAQTREVGDSVHALLSGLTDAETGQRGFLLTGEERYLNPYNRATGAIPDQLAHLKSLLATRPGESANVVRLDSLVDQKLAELRNTIELRRKQGPQAALDMVLSDQGKRLMDETRAVGAEIERQEISAQSQPSAEGQAAAGTALLVTVAGSLVLLFLFAFGLEPFASPEPLAWRRSWPLRYGAAVLAVVAIALLRAALTPLIGRTNLPFTMFFCAVAFAGWFGGFRPAVLSIALSLLAGDYFFAEPTGTLRVSGRDDQVAMLLLVVVGFGIALLSRAQRSAVDHALRAAERVEQLNTDLQNSVQSLAVANRDLERFAFVASHDLQEPLRMITTYAQLLVKNYPGQIDQDATTFVGTIVDGTRRMRELLGDLLAYSEIGARLEEPPEAVDLNQVIESVRQNLKVSIEESRAIVVSDRLPTVSGHQSHFIQLFQNLIGNALKYRGDDPPRIRVTVQEADSHLRFAVSDNGIGIAPEDREKIFEVFRRLHGKDVAGTGIGLAICLRVVERYAGRIWVESQVGQGAMFVFTLPKASPLAAATG